MDKIFEKIVCKKQARMSLYKRPQIIVDLDFRNFQTFSTLYIKPYEKIWTTLYVRKLVRCPKMECFHFLTKTFTFQIFEKTNVLIFNFWQRYFDFWQKNILIFDKKNILIFDIFFLLFAFFFEYISKYFFWQKNFDFWHNVNDILFSIFFRKKK